MAWTQLHRSTAITTLRRNATNRRALHSFDGHGEQKLAHRHYSGRDMQGDLNATDVESKAGIPAKGDGSLVLTAAYLYYVDEQSQEKIAESLAISRSTVSRLLTEARRTGIVRIEVAAPPLADGLRGDLREKLGLDDVYVAPGVAPHGDPGAVLSRATRHALLDCRLQAGDAILVSWGRAMWSVSRSELPVIPGVVVVPALGGLNEEQPWLQTNEIARQLAARLHGTVQMLHAPVLPSVELRKSLLSDETVGAALRRWDDAKAVLVGIGAWKHAEPLPPSVLGIDAKTLARSAGDVAARLMDADGRPISYETESRLLGANRKQLGRIERRIGVAVGVHKVAAIVAAARSGLINALITDVVTAGALLASASTPPASPPSAMRVEDNWRS